MLEVFRGCGNTEDSSQVTTGGTAHYSIFGYRSKMGKNGFKIKIVLEHCIKPVKTVPPGKVRGECLG